MSCCVAVREEREGKTVKSRAALGSSFPKSFTDQIRKRKKKNNKKNPINYEQEKKDTFWTSASVIFTNMRQRYSKFEFDIMLIIYKRPVGRFDTWLCNTVAPRVFLHYIITLFWMFITIHAY